jgi:hypothetical protein
MMEDDLASETSYNLNMLLASIFGFSHLAYRYLRSYQLRSHTRMFRHYVKPLLYSHELSAGLRLEPD